MSVAEISLVGVQIEGSLLAADMPTELLTGSLKGQRSEDFGFSPAAKLADEMAIAWGDAKAYWAAFQRMLARLEMDDTATSATREYWVVPLLKSLGFDPAYTRQAQVVDGRTFAISHRVEPGEHQPPLHVVGCRVDLEKRPLSGNPRLSAHALVQEYLNRTEHLWAIVTNGLRWRLLRDSSLMTRLTYIEFDLEQILNGENFAEFCLFYRLFHRSRLPQGIEDTEACLLEFYHQESIQQGGRVRDRLRDGVERALVTLGNGFLQHPGSDELRQKLESKELAATDYYQQLLRLIYRLLFLMVTEARDLLLEGSDEENRRIYREYYSVGRLRLRAEIPSHRREGFQDIWQGLLVTFRLFEGDAENWRGKMLGLSPLNGDLFGTGSLPALSGCGLDNHDLLTAIRSLSLYEQKGQLRRVNYAAIDVEEFGSVYESLLDFYPQIRQRGGSLEFQLVSGSERKTTGSYYTPRELVQQLIKSALEPVIAERLQGLSTQQEKETALLGLKIIDPACGSGHFLLAAARRVGLELARVQTSELEPGEVPRREAQRSVIQNCIYGVDLNPLAVDLCKVGLWIEGFCKGRPLSFLDRRIKCGNSLVGVLDLQCLKDGIPDKAFEPVTGDVKSIAAKIKKRNKKERSTSNQLVTVSQSIEFNFLPEIAQKSSTVGALPEETAADVKLKKQQDLELKKDPLWLTTVEACNLWTAAFFMPLTETNLALLPTSEDLARYLQERKSGVKNSMEAIVTAANEMAQNNRFFHWHLEYPEVFDRGGFDCVLGNPPWERIKLQEKEFFAGRDTEIANAANKAARDKLIKELERSNPDLARSWEEAKHIAEAQSKFVRESNRFPLTAVGDVNTYAIFSETVLNLIAKVGKASIIVPTGIATDDTCKKFFGDLGQSQTLVSLYDFENREKLFAAVDSRMKFSLLSISGRPTEFSEFSFFSTNVRHLENNQRVFRLSAKEIALLNPNTLTCPVFRTRNDAELTKKIYRQVPVLQNEKTGQNPWDISFMAMFHMSNDSGLFKTEIDDSDDKFVRLYEAKMLHQFDHRWATYNTEGNTRDITDAEKADRDFLPLPRYWVERSEVDDRLANKWKKDWLIGFRDICRSTDERTAIFSVLPKVGVGNKAPLIFPQASDGKRISCLLGCLDSLIFDFVTRQKLGGTTMNFFIVKQLPVLPPETYTQADIDFIAPRVLELVYTAWDMQPFARDMGYDDVPFLWNPERRAYLRAELDAYYAYLYGLDRDELRYILDPADIHGADFPSETFRVLKNNEMKQFGEYRTQRLVLTAWDRLFGPTN
jgi:hypothetical protein